MMAVLWLSVSEKASRHASSLAWSEGGWVLWEERIRGALLRVHRETREAGGGGGGLHLGLFPAHEDAPRV